jgi:DNA repair protein RecN (Recombination protein N)
LDLVKSFGIEMSDDTLLIKREMFLSGHNSCHINGQPATLQMLKQIGNILINIHGQHDGLYLLNDDFHIEYLDQFCKIDSLLDDYIKKYDSLLQLSRKIKSLSLSENEKNKRLKEIEVLIKKLEAAEVSENEWSVLVDTRNRLYSEEKLATLLNEVSFYLDGNDDVQGAYAKIASALESLKKTKNSLCDDVLASKLSTAMDSIAEVTTEVFKTLSSLEYSQELLNRTETRLEQLENLANQCKCDPNELDKILKSLYDEQGSLSSIDQNVDSLKTLYTEQRNELVSTAERIHSVRTSGAEELSKQIEQGLKFLNMPNAKFSVDIELLPKFGKKGIDSVRFFLSANRGEDLKPLSKVASGGELSRIMLCFKNVLRDSNANATSIFDEIDTGVSGKAASRVAQMLYSIGAEGQVLCVTHLPQIASVADYQYRISKSTVDNRTVTSVELLDEAGRIEDLSRLIGGENITLATKESAAQMLRQKNENYLLEDV